MKNKYTLLGLNYNNESRADVNLTIKSLNITSIEDVNIKIDTGCPYTSIPIFKTWNIGCKGAADEAD